MAPPLIVRPYPLLARLTRASLGKPLRRLLVRSKAGERVGVLEPGHVYLLSLRERAHSGREASSQAPVTPAPRPARHGGCAG
jgi:hypothetical protein